VKGIGQSSIALIKVVNFIQSGTVSVETNLSLPKGADANQLRLFLPYFKGAKSIKICDPYIRLQYQIYNFMSFCEILNLPEDTLKVDLVTACDSYLEAELKDKLNELKKGLSRDHIEFDYV